MDLRTATERFIDHCRISKRLSAHTLRAYETDLTEFAAFAGRDLAVDAIDRETLRAFARRLFDERDLKETTVKRRMAALKVMFRWLERDEAIGLSPFHRLDMSIRLPRTLPKALSADEIRRLLRRAETEASISGGAARHGALMMRFAVICLFTTGLRVGELTGVGLSDLDVEAATILVRGKGNRERRVFLPSRDCPGGLEPMMKPVVALVGDTVAVSSAGVTVNGQILAHSVPLSRDGDGRPLPQAEGGTVTDAQIWVVSDYNERSFDSRYFGPIPQAQLTAILRPLWTETSP